ncbi:unnamed protein product [Malus baccata var. baccata]
MADTLSPNPATQKRRLPMAARLQYPTRPFFIGSNDDNHKHVQARAAPAFAIRRKFVALNLLPQQGDPNHSLRKAQILELFQNCIKLSSDYKINQKNTWELNLIDHLTVIINVVEEKDAETNFQKESCTLEAGVKIYSMRVDSVHTEAYKVLGGMNRVGQESEQDTRVEDANVDNGKDVASSRMRHRRRLTILTHYSDLLNSRILNADINPYMQISPSSTLESSFGVCDTILFVFSVAFAVDPLYHQTSTQFDEGGAKGLLMNNLGVYGGCRRIASDNQLDKSDTIDLSFAGGEYIYTCDQESAEQVDAAYSNEADFDCDVSDNCGNWDYDHDDQTSVVEEDLNCESSNFPSYHENNEPGAYHELDMDERLEKVYGFLFLSLGFTSKQNAWVGLDHWKHRKIKENDRPAEQPVTVKQKKTKAQQDLDFTKSLEEEFLVIFSPPKNPKSLLLLARLPLLTRRAYKAISSTSIHYDKTSKQVDVQPLKETLWNHVQESVQTLTQRLVSFKQILGNFPSDCRAAETINDIFPHPCFICLLHLANEHGLMILGSPNLDDLSIHVT